jgi:hypothetical protein
VRIDEVEIGDRAIRIDNEAASVSGAGLAVDEMGDFQIRTYLQAFDAWDGRWVAGCGGVDGEQRELACTCWDGNGGRRND